MPKIVIGVVLARCPHGAAGNTCAVINWALAFREIGWDVWIAEHLDDDELDPPAHEGADSPQEEFWRATCMEFGFENQACLIVNGSAGNFEEFREFARDADAFLNFSGQFKRLDLLGPRTRKFYLDVDPAFTQLWAEVCGSNMNFEGHDVFLTVGSNLTGPTARVPTAGRSWVPIFPVISASVWRGRAGIMPAPGREWTTIAHWYGYSNLVWQDREYAGKRESFLAMRQLPRLADVPLTIATDLRPEWGDHEEFESLGWKFRKAAEVCGTIPDYLKFIAESRGEIGIAKGGYIVSQTGWISDRSLVYLALGRPVLLHDTGWPLHVRCEGGLVPFHTAEDCAKALKSIEENYDAHARAARILAETTFSPKAVLEPLLKR